MNSLFNINPWTARTYRRSPIEQKRSQHAHYRAAHLTHDAQRQNVRTSIAHDCVTDSNYLDMLLSSTLRYRMAGREWNLFVWQLHFLILSFNQHICIQTCSDLQFALTLSIDWVALSFVQKPEDILELRELAGPDIKVNKGPSFISLIVVIFLWLLYFYCLLPYLTPHFLSTLRFHLLYRLSMSHAFKFHIYLYIMLNCTIFAIPIILLHSSQLMAKLEKPSAIDYLDEVR